MKTVKTLFLAIITVSLAFAACNNNNNDDDSTPSGPYLRAKVDGIAFESNTSLLTGQAAFGEVVIGGYESAFGKSISLDFTENLAEGTYIFDGSVDEQASAAYYAGGIAGSTYGDVSGSFTILEYDTVANSVKGTFNFVGVDALSEDSVHVTDGEFFMEYQQ